MGFEPKDGKAVSAQNARKHGLFGRDVAHDQEDAEAFDELLDGLRAQFNPGSALEDELVNQLAMAFWRNRRLAKSERNHINYQIEERKRNTIIKDDESKPVLLNIRQFVLYGRYQTMITNEIRRTLQMLAEAQDRRINAIEAVVSDVTESDGVGSDVAESGNAH